MAELVEFLHEPSGVTVRTTPASAARMQSLIRIQSEKADPKPARKTKTNSSKEGK